MAKKAAKGGKKKGGKLGGSFRTDWAWSPVGSRPKKTPKTELAALPPRKPDNIRRREGGGNPDDENCS